MVKTKPISIALADDHTLFREGLVQILKSYKEVSIMDQAANGAELIELLAKTKKLPDVCIVDINMPVMNGYDTVDTIRKSYKDISTLALSMYDDEKNIVRMLRCGAKGYLLKDCDPEELVNAIVTVHETGFYNSDIITSDIKAKVKKAAPEKNKTFTEKELEFLQICSTDHTYKEIARILDVSERTVDGYRDRLFTKMKVRSRTGMVIEGMRLGLIKLY